MDPRLLLNRKAMKKELAKGGRSLTLHFRIVLLARGFLSQRILSLLFHLKQYLD